MPTLYSEESPILASDLKALTRLSTVMDEAVDVPVLGVKFGLDPILGLIPGLGDALGALLSAGHIIAALRHHVPGRVVARMVANILMDLFLGLAPGLGDVIDVVVRHHSKNLKLLLQHKNDTIEPRELPFLIKIAIVSLILLPALLVSSLGAWMIFFLFQALTLFNPASLF